MSAARIFSLALCLSVPQFRAFTPSSTTTTTTIVTLDRKQQQRQSTRNYVSASLLRAVECDATLSEQTFAELYGESQEQEQGQGQPQHLPDWLLEKCQANGWISPTLIQERALDCFFNDQPNSMVIQAQTGSGKTLTYLLPLLAKLENRAATQAMIVVPTRELGLQVATVAKRLAARKFMVMSLLQGSKLRRQRAWAWAETPHVVIGTPTELLDMVQYGGLPRINSINYVVVDEVDACLFHNTGAVLTTTTGGGSSSGDTESASALNTLLSKFLSPTYQVDDGTGGEKELLTLNVKRPQRKLKHRQTVFASATIPQHRHFLKQCKANQWTLEEPVFVCTSPGEALPPSLTHAYMVCQTKDKKVATLRRLLPKLLKDDRNKVLVFCDPSRPMEEMASAIAHDLKGVRYQDGKTKLDDLVEGQQQPVVSVLRFEDSLSMRAGATKAFSSKGPSRVMLTADLAARGLDIAGITHVVHFDLPPDADTYLHRSGRAGRLGQKGQVVSILTPDQEFVLQRLSNALTLDLKCVGRQKAAKNA